MIDWDGDKDFDPYGEETKQTQKKIPMKKKILKKKKKKK